MKAKLFTLAVILTCIFSFSGFSQTTEEEYNYITKGYKVQIESGLDMKKGYELKDMGEWNLNYQDSKRGMKFKGLYRTGSSKPCAIMAIYERINTEGINTATEYYCIPTIDAKDLWDRTLEQMNSQSSASNVNQVYGAMLWAFMKLASENLTK